jgi:signal transduction histidine kinase/type II secretory pathway pseudopilin PulG
MTQQILRSLPLPRLYAIVAALVFILATAAVGVLRFHTATQQMQDMVQESNAALAVAMSAMATRDHRAWFEEISARDRAKLGDDQLTRALTSRLAEAMRDTRVIKVNIFDYRGLAVFSTDPSEIGEDASANPGFRKALTGRPLSHITHHDEVDTFHGVRFDREVISTYVPAWSDNARTAQYGVFEIYSDITELKAAILHDIAVETVSMILFLGIVYLLLFGVVSAGHRSVERAHRERLALTEAVARAEAASRAKSEFLASMSHELRTPLNAILGFSEIMTLNVMGPMPPQYHAYAEDIHASGQHLLHIVDDVLDLARIEHGHLALSYETVEADRLTGEVLDMVQPQAKAAGVVLRGQVDRHLPPLRTDATRLRQILLNLLGNAVKFTPRGGRILLQVTRSADGQGMALSVVDNGIGIAPGDIATCLSPFGQVEGPMVRQRGGTGLGLPLAEKLARLLGGRLELRSILGAGTTVTVHLPLTAADPASVPLRIDAAA